MKKRFWILGIIIMISSVQAICQDISSSYSLSGDIFINDTCFNIIASDLVLDGKGYRIISNGTGYGINASSVDNITIRNLGIFNFSYGIRTSNSANLTILNNSITPASNYGMYLIGAHDSEIYLNNISSYGFADYGIWLLNSNRSLINNNHIYTYGNSTEAIIVSGNSYFDQISGNSIYGSHDDCHAIRLSGGGQSSVSNNIMNMTGYRNHGIYSYSGTDYANYTNNTVFTYGDLADGIRITDANYLTINNNKVTTYRDADPVNLVDCNNILVKENNVTTYNGTADAIYIRNAVDNTVKDNFIYPNGTALYLYNINYTLVSGNFILGGDGIDMNQFGSFNRFLSNVINTQGAALIFSSSSVFSNITNNTIKSKGRGIELSALSGPNLIENNDIYTNGTAREGMLIYSGNNTIRFNNITTAGSSSPAIKMRGNNNSIIFNNLSTTGLYSEGIYLDNCDLNNISRNLIRNRWLQSYGVYTYSSDWSQISQNNITTLGYIADGIKLDGSDHNIIKSNVIVTNDTSANGIWDYRSSNNSISYNEISTYDSQASGILIEDAYSTNVSFNNMTTYDYGSHGLNIDQGYGNIYFRNNMMTFGQGSSGIHFDVSSNSNHFIENNITTNHTWNAYGIDIWGHNNTFIGNKINARNSWDLFTHLNVRNTKFYHNLIKGINFSADSMLNVLFMVHNSSPSLESGQVKLFSYNVTNSTEYSFSIAFNVSYDESGISNESLRAYEYSGGWQIVSDSYVDTGNAVIYSGNITNTGMFAMIGNASSTEPYNISFHVANITLNYSEMNVSVIFNITNNEPVNRTYNLSASAGVLNQTQVHLVGYNTSGINLTLPLLLNTHAYQVYAVHYNGSSVFSASISLTGLDLIAPNINSTLNATYNADAGIFINWTADSNADRYYLYRHNGTISPNSTYLAANISATNWTDTSYKQKNMTYHYYLTAIDTSGNENTSSFAYSNATTGTECSNAYGSWSSWSTCSGGTQSRTRTRACYLYSGTTSQQESQDCTVSPSGGGSSGRSSSGGSAATNKAIVTFTKENRTRRISLDGLVIYEAEAVIDHSVILTFYRLDEKPEMLPDEREAVYKYVEVTSTREIGAKLRFSVEKSWIGRGNKSLVRMFRYKEGWVELDTKIIDENETYVYYESYTPGFSYFKIGSVEPPEQETTKEEINDEVIMPEYNHSLVDEHFKSLVEHEETRPLWLLIGSLMCFASALGLSIWVKKRTY